MSQSSELAEKITLTQERQESRDKAIFGFWVYIMTDCVLFASLFAVYAVLHGNTANGPSGKQIFDINYVLAETLILLTSSFTCGLGLLAASSSKLRQTVIWYGLTFLLGLSFLALEIKEFHHLASIGDGWQRSGFLSSYFALVGTHGLHITVGLIWMLVIIIQVMSRGLGFNTLRRLNMLSLFWHFLDVVWIFIFTIVYLMGVAK